MPRPPSAADSRIALEECPGHAGRAAAARRQRRARGRLDGHVRLAGLLNTLLGLAGLIDRPLQIMYTEPAVIVGITTVNLPFMVLTLESVIEGIDPAIEEAAASLGARPLQVFRRVVLPLAMPGVLAGTILVFILGMNATPRRFSWAGRDSR